MQRDANYVSTVSIVSNTIKWLNLNDFNLKGELYIARFQYSYIS